MIAGIPTVSVIVPTYGRPRFLPRAVESALSQTVDDLEVVVVDDASDLPVQVPDDPRVRLVRLDANVGIAGALTAGARAARGRWIAHLDDDDVLLPHMLERSLDAAATCSLPGPVVVISGIELVRPDGRVLQRRLPPTRPRGSHFSLEPLEPGRAYETRATMVAEKALLGQLGYWDSAFRSSARHDLFLRMNPHCSILGIPVVTYRQVHHGGSRVSTDAASKHESFKLLERKHSELFSSHPKRYAHYLVGDAFRLVALGERTEAIKTIARAWRLSPATTLSRATRLAYRAAARSARRCLRSRTGGTGT